MPTIDQFKLWARQQRPLAETVVLAQAYAQTKRAQVDAYLAPIFEARTFPIRAEWADKAFTMRSYHDLYLCDDEVLCAEFYDRCDEAHRAHGWNGPKGHCPALEAEYLLMQAEHALMDAADPLFHIGRPVLMEQRTKYLDLLLGACLVHSSARDILRGVTA